MHRVPEWRRGAVVATALAAAGICGGCGGDKDGRERQEHAAAGDLPALVEQHLFSDAYDVRVRRCRPAATAATEAGTWYVCDVTERTTRERAHVNVRVLRGGGVFVDKGKIRGWQIGSRP